MFWEKLQQLIDNIHETVVASRPSPYEHQIFTVSANVRDRHCMIPGISYTNTSLRRGALGWILSLLLPVRQL